VYDELSADYDRFVDWPSRLAAELPFIERELHAVEARSVLDVACGTGAHAIALSGRGYRLTGTDLSAPMIERARAGAVKEGAAVRFEVAGFGQASALLGTRFDAVLCLGNSLPHILAPEELQSTLHDFAACLRPGGLLLIQNRNFDAVLARRARWMDPQGHRHGEAEWLFQRFYDFEPDGKLVFNMVTLRREGDGPWRQQVASTRLWPLRSDEIAVALGVTGFSETAYWGDMQGAPFDRDRSPNLVVTARKEPGNREKVT
jgi:SAM-dependent methyltransferase